jgi:hypothetical protein
VSAALAASTNSDWYLGLVIGFAVVVVVVVLVAVILTTAARIGDQARRAAGGLDEVRAGTEVLWKVRETNAAAPAILAAARAAREAVAARLTGGTTAPSAPAPAAPPPGETAASEPARSQPATAHPAPPLGAPRPGPHRTGGAS